MKNLLIRIYRGGTRPEYRELSRRERENLLDAQDNRGELEGILTKLLKDKKPSRPGYPSADAYVYGNTSGIQFNYSPRDK